MTTDLTPAGYDEDMRTTRKRRTPASALLAKTASTLGPAPSHRHAQRAPVPLLTDLLDRGWIADGYYPSPHDAPGDGAPDQPQHYYVVTDLGRTELARV
ncbi:hypothetical protein ATK36_1943 [Amycolatopsis sulphurea]|uniref:Uncharacterized protein n=1 Tax=Amycolatopsis sulphurea TaxID=76022 RepID=A0A2A9F6A9_9PSEU|nr:hypothetical protein [Amycolatopsis sulphurea]PFG46937.1 hypothetical protein ATK36_1943 [Amycolatopsis sulphurea]